MSTATARRLLAATLTLLAALALTPGSLGARTTVIALADPDPAFIR